MNTLSLLRCPEDILLGCARRMRARRKEKKWTQKELSARSGVSLGSLKRFEQTGEVSLSSLVNLAFALGCEGDFDELFSKRSYASIQEVIDEARENH